MLASQETGKNSEGVFPPVIQYVPSQLTLQSIIIIHRVCACFSEKCDRIYATFREESFPIQSDCFNIRIEDVKRAVFLFPLTSSVKNGSLYPPPTSCILASCEVSSLAHLKLVQKSSDLILVGTDSGRVEVWDYKDNSSPNLVRTLNDVDSFGAIYSLIAIGGASQRLSFATVQEGENMGILFSLFQPKNVDIASVDFQMAAKICYKSCFPEMSCHGDQMLFLAYDKFGCLYLDVYQIIGSTRFAVELEETIKLPKDVEVTNFHPEGGKRIQFINRINTHTRIEVDPSEDDGVWIAREPLRHTFNGRFVVISANGGMTGSNGEKKSCPGLIVIDLYEQANHFAKHSGLHRAVNMQILDDE